MADSSKKVPEPNPVPPQEASKMGSYITITLLVMLIFVLYKAYASRSESATKSQNKVFEWRLKWHKDPDTPGINPEKREDVLVVDMKVLDYERGEIWFLAWFRDMGRDNFTEYRGHLEQRYDPSLGRMVPTWKGNWTQTKLGSYPPVGETGTWEMDAVTECSMPLFNGFVKSPKGQQSIRLSSYLKK
jgi:hypothetical protein